VAEKLKPVGNITDISVLLWYKIIERYWPHHTVFEL